METDIGQAISVIANIGVIAGILFVAAEVRQNNRLLEAQARNAARGIMATVVPRRRTKSIADGGNMDLKEKGYESCIRSIL